MGSTVNQAVAASEHWRVMGSAKSHEVIRERINHSQDPINPYSATCGIQNLFEEHHQDQPNLNGEDIIVSEMVVDQGNSDKDNDRTPVDHNKNDSNEASESKERETEVRTL